MYAIGGLRDLLSDYDINGYARESLIAKISTIEQLCRELDFRPDSTFLGAESAA